MISASRADIADMAAMIVRAVAPERIILFGSRARGDERPESDVDFLVVTEFTGPRRETALAIRRALRGRGVAKDILVVTPDEAQRYARVPGSVIYPAVREGSVLYERPE
jgi:predicted nucleotidyltransferase